jgi:hypothetical protein
VLKQTGNVDKMVVYFDMPRNYTVDGKGITRVKIKITDYEKWRVMAMLCITANSHK